MWRAGAAGLLVESANVTLTHVTASGNYASNYGGGMDNYWATVNVINSVLWGNVASHGATNLRRLFRNDTRHL